MNLYKKLAIVGNTGTDNGSESQQKGSIMHANAPKIKLPFILRLSASRLSPYAHAYQLKYAKRLKDRENLPSII